MLQVFKTTQNAQLGDSCQGCSTDRGLKAGIIKRETFYRYHKEAIPPYSVQKQRREMPTAQYLIIIFNEGEGSEGSTDRILISHFPKFEN